MKKVMIKSLAAAVIAASAGAAMAEVSASAQADSIYLFRGNQLGGAQISGSLDYSHDSGLYAGVWATSANEADYYAGFAGGDEEGLTYDIGVTRYTYWDGSGAGTDDFNSADGFNATEVSLILSMSNVTLEVWKGVGDWHAKSSNTGDAIGNEDMYVALSYSMDKFTVLLGSYMGDYDAADTELLALDLAGEDMDYQHLDVTYAFNDNLSFTASKVIGSDDCALGTGDWDNTTGDCVNTSDRAVPDDLKFLVSYALPI